MAYDERCVHVIQREVNHSMAYEKYIRITNNREKPSYGI